MVILEFTVLRVHHQVAHQAHHQAHHQAQVHPHPLQVHQSLDLEQEQDPDKQPQQQPPLQPKVDLVLALLKLEQVDHHLAVHHLKHQAVDQLKLELEELLLEPKVKLVKQLRQLRQQ